FDSASSTWSEQNPSESPPARSALGLAYDADRDEVVLFGGIGDDGVTADTWVLRDDGSWHQLNPVHAPPGRFQHAMSASESSDGKSRVLLVGGVVGGGNAHDAWEWRGGGSDVAAHIFRAPFSAAGVIGASVSSIDVAGASSAAAGTVEVRVWAHGAWQSGAVVDDTSPIAISENDVDTLVGPAQTLNVALAAGQPAGPIAADADNIPDLSTSFVSATFHYRLPAL
ncbi:MAG TPA: kelch repeat-containing protein, partial [Myxococcota bacterium]